MSDTQDLSGPEGIKKIADLIKGIHICMMTTAAGDGTFDSRPMAMQKAEFDGTVWFLTPAATGKVAEIRNDDNIGLLFSDPSNSKYVSAKGYATVSQDKAKIHELWNPMFKAWFPRRRRRPADSRSQSRRDRSSLLGGIIEQASPLRQISGSRSHRRQS